MSSFTETTSDGWFSRIGNAFKGLLLGLIACAGSVVLLFWNEGRAVQTAKSLEEGANTVVSVSTDSVSPENQDKLVHITGEATTDEILRDKQFKVTENAITLSRRVEMFQWVEDQKKDTQKKTGGGTKTTTTYSYRKAWARQLVDSNKFHERGRDQYRNPVSMPVRQETSHAKLVTVGAYTLGAALSKLIKNPSTIGVSDRNIPPALADRVILQDASTLYYGKNPQNPAIGDCRITFEITKPTTISVVAQQTGNTFRSYETNAGDSLSMLRLGTVSADQMFKKAQDENRNLTWILRGVGCVVMFIGLMMFTRPVTVLADVLPILGNIAEMGFALVCGLLTVAGSSTTIGVAWVFYRPWIGIPLIALSIGAIVMLFVQSRRVKSGNTFTTAGEA